jgi:hypothetical protein
MQPRTVKRLLSIAAILVILGLAVTIFDHLNGPSRGSVTALTVQQQKSAIVFNLKPVKVVSPEASFSYPAALTMLSSDMVKPPVLAIYNYGYKYTESWRLAITVNQLNGSSLNSDGSYALDMSEPATYSLSHATYNGISYAIMTNTQASGFSKVAFTVNGSRSADISLYGDDENGTAYLQKTFLAVLRSWKWN